MYQCSGCRDIDKAIRVSLRQEKVSPKSADAKKQDRFHEIAKHQFTLAPIPRDGHCLYRAFIAGYQKVTKKHLTLQEVRAKVSDYMLQSNGQIPGEVYASFTRGDDDVIRLSDPLRVLRGSKVENVPTTLEQYAKLVLGTLYGGDMEIAVLAHVFSIQICVYSWHFFDGKRRFRPQIFGDAERGFDMLFDQNFRSKTGRQDHYDVIVDKFPKWRKLMNAMPTWKVDIGLVVNARGRGVKALRSFKKGDALLFYDGHRVCDKGNVVIGRVQVDDLYTEHNVDPRVRPFQKTHAVCLGRTHVTGLQIDGYPLTLDVFDDVLDVGRGALANSGTTRESSMRMVWFEAPDLDRDVINHLSDCEGFLVARRDIQCVISSLLFNVMSLKRVAGLARSCCGITRCIESRVFDVRTCRLVIHLTMTRTLPLKSLMRSNNQNCHPLLYLQSIHHLPKEIWWLKMSQKTMMEKDMVVTSGST